MEVKIDCPDVNIGPGSTIGIPDEVTRVRSVHTPPGVLVRCSRLELGEKCSIAPGVVITGGTIRIGSGSRIHPGVTIRVTELLELGKNSVIGPESLIEGRKIKIGRELWCGPQVRIGGGSCFEPQSEFTAGYWLHLGMRVFINTARPVTIGNETGLGTNTAVYTHGAYQSALMGYPVQFAPVSIGDNCWIPGAIINPGVTIGSGAVIGVGSVVTKSIPPGALAVGVPCRVVKENAFPRPLEADERRAFFVEFLSAAAPILEAFTKERCEFDPARCCIRVGEYTLEVTQDNLVISAVRRSDPLCTFSFGARAITGSATPFTEKVRDLLRRYGIRFKSEAVDGSYRPWEE